MRMVDVVIGRVRVGRTIDTADTVEQVAGLEVRGYKPTEVEREQLIRSLGRNLPRATERVDAIASETPPSPPAENPSVPSASARARERVAGTLLEHGRDSY